MSQNVTIIGGGVIGLSAAWELARRGVQVTLLERDRIGRATSWAGAGILPAANFAKATDPIDQLRGLSHELFPQWTNELSTATGLDCGFRTCGGWYLADTKGERAAMLGMTNYWEEIGIECKLVELPELAEREPALQQWAAHADDALAWWVPDESQIRPPHYLQALEKACLGAGVKVIEGAEIEEVHTSSNLASARTADRTYESDSILVCGGAWTGRIAKSLGLEFSIVPIRGQILLLKTDVPLVRGVLNVGQRYILCRDDGHTLVGSNEEEVGFELGTTDSTLNALHQFAVEFVPALASAKRLDAWSGLRPMTFDGFPMIGRAPGTSNLFVAAGHFRSGLHLSPGTAVVVSDLITEREPPIDLESFRVGKQQASTTTGYVVSGETT